MRIISYILAITMFAFLPLVSRAQTGNPRASIEGALAKENIPAAHHLLNQTLNRLLSEKNADSLVNYLSLLGEVTEKLSGVEKAAAAVNAMLTRLKNMPASSMALEQGYMNAAEFFAQTGKNKMAYDATKTAQEYAQVNNRDIGRLALFERNLGEYARRMANPDLSQQHLRRAVALAQSAKNISSEDLYLTYNSIASMMWYESKTDSAKYFYLKAIEEVQKIDSTPLNRYFRMALLHNNVAGIYNLEGNTTEATRAIEITIGSLRKFLQSGGYESKRKTAMSLQFEAIDNLAGIYKALGDYAKAEQLLNYSYQQKKTHLSPTDPALFISQILLGQLFYARREYKKAMDYLNNGRQALLRESGDYLFWNGDACYTLALIYEAQKNPAMALRFYTMADSLYTTAFQGSYDEIYLDFSRNYTLFQATNNDCEGAIKKAGHILNYLTRTGNRQSQLYFHQLLNLAGIYSECKNFEQSLHYSQQSLANIRQHAGKGKSLIDSIRTEVALPDALFLSAKAKYNLLKQKDFNSIASILKELNQASGIIERRKAILSDPKDVSALLASYQQIGAFIKELNYELLKLSGDKKYIDTIISTHENNVYTRIRSHIDQQKAMRFAGLPDNILKKEQDLKERIRSILERDGKQGENVISYMNAVAEWTRFQQTLKKNHPHYYQMRYGNTNISAQQIALSLPDDITVVRYIYSSTGLLAFVVSRNRQQLVALSSANLIEKITALSQPGISQQNVVALAHQLYRQLWMPLEKTIQTKRVTIIPDGILYNLSFEILTPVATRSYRELSQYCLLNRHALSYHYSLHALLLRHEPARMKGNFVAFAPGFFENDKQQYLNRAKGDSMRLDQNYLALLPLPFTGKLINKLKTQFGGNVFTQNRSTPETFRKESGNHHIIHIGTHAEANNEFPEYSRLIFAKDEKDVDAENSIYLFDIYNCDLTSDLSVLTACESGKPGYQDGEGMISMAHAFTYAGSKSIMTGLWKLDEQSTSIITEYFYKYLKRGLGKDEALQKAKLDYLQHINGRMIAPQYWAGLVLMGNTDPVTLRSSNRWVYYGIGFLTVLTMAAWLFWRKRNRERTGQSTHQ